MLIRRDVGETYGGGNIRETGRHLSVQLLKRYLIWTILLSTVKTRYSVSITKHRVFSTAVTAA